MCVTTINYDSIRFEVQNQNFENVISHVHVLDKGISFFFLSFDKMQRDFMIK